MNLNDNNYSKYALVREMMETAEVIRRFDPAATERFVQPIRGKKGLFMTGEGSSRIFPAKRTIYASLKDKQRFNLFTEGATQALEYDLTDLAVFGASNSGKTKEVVRLFKHLKETGHNAFFGLTANADTPLQELALDTHVLGCGKEDAVAATKSVIEQGLFYDSLYRHLTGKKMSGLDALAGMVEEAMTLKVDASITEKIKNAGMIYFAGRNTGVAEELTLKTNEITRKKSDFLEGTYAAHGIEEVMNPDEVVIVVDPFESEEEKFQEVLVKGVGLTIVAISHRQTSFPTILIPDGGEYKEYVELAAGWNVLVETGLALNINLDKPERARKVGNEYTGE
jgi:glucosamine--fructose-6-phosphate aminotransferase (isomerizing)